MTADQQKPQFEPPPWEREAFDRFHAERNATRAEEELDSALQAIRSDQEQAHPEPVVPPAIQLPDATQVLGVTATAEVLASTIATEAKIPEAHIEAMLVQLRGEEGPTTKPNTVLINGAMGFMAISGILLLVQAAALFAQAEGEGVGGAGLMFAAAVSLFIFFTGAGFLGGAYLLFRKYHR